MLRVAVPERADDRREPLAAVADRRRRLTILAMTDLEKFRRACRLFLARLVMVHGENAPEVLRRMADDLEWLEAERAAEAAGGVLGRSN